MQLTIKNNTEEVLTRLEFENPKCLLELEGKTFSPLDLYYDKEINTSFVTYDLCIEIPVECVMVELVA